MNKKKLKKLVRRVRSLRQASANLSFSKLSSLAAKFERKRSDRGKEPTFVSTVFSDLRPITIPGHPGAINRFTAEGILDQFDEDVIHWQNYLNKKPKP